MKKAALTTFYLFIMIISILSQEGSMTITSTAFKEGGSIPAVYSCKGDDSSPPLAWSGVPEGTKTFVLICDDPDAPIGTWVHWVYFDIPAETTGLPEGFPSGAAPSIGGVQGKNSWKRNDYGGPCPPSGTHRYYFKLYALDTVLGLGSDATKAKVEKAMEGHILAQAEIMGTFKK